jgi:hypothetical protein
MHVPISPYPGFAWIVFWLVGAKYCENAVYKAGKAIRSVYIGQTLLRACLDPYVFNNCPWRTFTHARTRAPPPPLFAHREKIDP